MYIFIVCVYICIYIYVCFLVCLICLFIYMGSVSSFFFLESIYDQKLLEATGFVEYKATFENILYEHSSNDRECYLRGQV